MLEKVDAQHALQSNRRATVAGLRIKRLDLRTQLAPWDYLVHLRQKLFPARRLAVALKISGGKGLLLHRGLSSINNARIIADVRT